MSPLSFEEWVLENMFEPIPCNVIVEQTQEYGRMVVRRNTHLTRAAYDAYVSNFNKEAQ